MTTSALFTFKQLATYLPKIMKQKKKKMTFFSYVRVLSYSFFLYVISFYPCVKKNVLFV